MSVYLPRSSSQLRHFPKRCVFLNSLCHLNRPSLRRLGTDARPVRAGKVSLKSEVRTHFLSSEEYPRTVFARDFARFAIGEDLEGLFEESGFGVDRIVMHYNPMTGFNGGNCHIVLRDSASVAAALAELQNAPLFDGRIRLEAVPSDWRPRLPESEWKLVDLHRGWHASNRPDMRFAKVREPLTGYPHDLFAPLREARRLTIDNMPYPDTLTHRERITELYGMFYRFDVLSVSDVIKYVPKDKLLSGWVSHIDFATKAHAEEALQFNHTMMAGRNIILSRTKIPLKYTTSWDSGRPSGHNKTGRDDGSAVGSNFEETQEELFRKWILGEKDRKLWVPTHTFRKHDPEKAYTKSASTQS